MLWPNKKEKHSKQTSSDKVLQVMIQDFPFPEFLYHTQFSTSKKLQISIFASPHNAIWRKYVGLMTVLTEYVQYSLTGVMTFTGVCWVTNIQNLAKAPEKKITFYTVLLVLKYERF